MKHSLGLVARCAALLLILVTAGCAGVKVASVSTQDYIAQRRGDVLTTGKLSAAASEALAVLGLDADKCRASALNCTSALRGSDGLDTERQLSTLSEVWLLHAVELERQRPIAATDRDELLDAYLQSARYAYLFHSPRPPAERAFEDRQTQVRDYYNYAVQQSVTRLFSHYRDAPKADAARSGESARIGDWNIHFLMDEVRLPGGKTTPYELIPASTLTFSGLRSMYRRDGFGAELVAVMARSVNDKDTFEQPYSETPFPALSVILSFKGRTLTQILETHDAAFTVSDPYRRYYVSLGGISVPLAANFTSGYGLWLARSGFATQALRNAIGTSDGLAEPHIYLLQPYDPDRRIIVMLHGLASSPEAWINTANEVLGDEVLRRGYQIWQVYYPTNAPLPYNNAEIRKALRRTLEHFDPMGTARASRDMVVIGHSMGGILSRLMVSSSGDVLWKALQEYRSFTPEEMAEAEAEFGDMMRFEPFHGITRAVFIATPHRGTEFAEHRLARWASNLITLPATVLRKFARMSQRAEGGEMPGGEPYYIPNGVDSLSPKDPFIRLLPQMPISPAVTFHSIVATDKPDAPLEESTDGFVTYHSAHLDGAASEAVIPYTHSVQEAPEAILEIRRVLREHLGAAK